MTQVASLNTGMNTTVKTTTASRQDGSKDLLAEFAGIMNQNVQSFLDTANEYETRSGAMTEDITSDGNQSDALKKNYETFGSASKGRTIAKTQTDRTDVREVAQNIQQLADDVKDTVKETMQVSEEDIAQAMEALGLTALDLLQPQNLIGLVQELTGSTDVSALLTDGNFQLTMQEVTGLIADFQQENGLNAAQFSDLLEQLSAQIDELEEAVKELLGVSETTEADAMTEQQMTGASEELFSDEEKPEATVQNATKTVAASETQSVGMQTTQEKLPQDTVEQVTEQSEMTDVQMEQTAQTTDQEKDPSSQQEKQPSASNGSDHTDMTAEQHAGFFSESTLVSDNPATVAQTETSQVLSYAELGQLMDQLEGLARIFASAEGTTVEMQLNPENLGRLVLSVTEKHGNLTAQITASNEQVKEALQTQMVELRSTLQAQGIKVEAVEVTVATHEFEQNLDGNTSANGQMQEQARRQQENGQNGRRNLNMNSLDQLSGLMSEEETLVAQMMRDNGGTVDFTA